MSQGLPVAVAVAVVCAVVACGGETDQGAAVPRVGWVNVIRAPDRCNWWTPMSVDSAGRAILASGYASNVIAGGERQDALFVARYSTTGKLDTSWEAPIGWNSDVYGLHEASNGNVLVQGRFHQRLATPEDPLPPIVGFIGEYDDGGRSVAWQELGFGNSDGVITLAPDGAPLMVVTVSDPIDFGGVAIPPAPATGVITRWNMTAAPDWVRLIPTENHLVMSMVTTHAGEVVVTGIFQGPFELGSVSTTLQQYGSYLAWLSADGTPVSTETTDQPYFWVQLSPAGDGDVLAVRTRNAPIAVVHQVARFGRNGGDRWTRYCDTPRIAYDGGSRFAIVGGLRRDEGPAKAPVNNDSRIGNRFDEPLRVTLANVEDGSEIARFELPGTEGVIVSQMEWAGPHSLILFGALASETDFGGATARTIPEGESDCFLMKLDGL